MKTTKRPMRRSRHRLLVLRHDGFDRGRICDRTWLFSHGTQPSCRIGQRTGGRIDGTMGEVTEYVR